MTTFRIRHLRRLGATCALALVLASTAFAETPAPADTAAEDSYLDILPAIDIPADVQPIPGAVNEEFRDCRSVWPDGYEQALAGPESRPLRDIYSFVRGRNVIASEDCSCSGKVANWNDVETVAASLRVQFETETLSWQHTKSISAQAKKLVAIAETMCGGAF